MPHAPDPIAAALFRTAGTAALGGWLLLALTLYTPRLRAPGWRLTGVALPAVLAVGYVAALAAALHTGARGGFGSLADVRALFTSDLALAAGWVHYLAFDLLVGTGVTRAGLDARVPRPLLLACLALTFVAGPAGLLAYLVCRAAAGRRARASGTSAAPSRGSASIVEALA